MGQDAAPPAAPLLAVLSVKLNAPLADAQGSLQLALDLLETSIAECTRVTRISLWLHPLPGPKYLGCDTAHERSRQAFPAHSTTHANLNPSALRAYTDKS